MKRSAGLATASLLSAWAAFELWGALVLLYPGLLLQAGKGLSAPRRLALGLVWGLAFAGVTYRWVFRFGLWPWLALTLVRGLPWLLFFLPVLLAERSEKDLKVPATGLGLGLVSLVLLAGMTGVDWETPAACLTTWPWLLRPLPTIGLSGVAILLGTLSAALVAGQPRSKGIAAGVLVVWFALSALWPTSSGDRQRLKVALIQPGWAQNQKWEESNRQAAVDRLFELTEQAAQKGAKLVIWPETAWPYRGMRKRFTNTRKIGKLARKLKIDLLVSSIEVDEDEAWRNSVSQVGPDGAFKAEYQKQRLAPFAEYIPWGDQTLRQYPLFAQISNYVPGDQSPLMTTSQGVRLATMICYESMTPSRTATVAPQSDLLVVVTNDAPFAHQAPAEAHFRSAILRAIQAGRPLVQASNTGVTGVIDAQGRVLTRTERGYEGPSVELYNLELEFR